MDEIILLYNHLMEVLNDEQKKYMHFKSVYNFLTHYDDFTAESEKYKIERDLSNYLEIISENIERIDNTITTELYIDHVRKIGALYNKIGFIEIWGLKFKIAIAFSLDIVIGFFFFGFPYPIMTALMVLNYFIRQRKKIKTCSVYGMLY